MIVLEILITALITVGLLVLALSWVARPLWTSFVRRWRIETAAEQMKAQDQQRLKQLRKAASTEVTEWLEKAGGGKLILPEGGLAAAVDPTLRAILERYPMNDRVLELARIYQQATGKELLPEQVRQAMQQQVDTPRAEKELSSEERAVLAEARREVEAWLSPGQ
jgi:hypothetical protein